MSGGSFNYLCYKNASQLLENSEQLDAMIDRLKDIEICSAPLAAAVKVRAKLDYIKMSLDLIDKDLSKLTEVFRAVEWYDSNDVGFDNVVEAVNEFVENI